MASKELILVVDAAQGIEAQTLANVYSALDNDLEILPALKLTCQLRIRAGAGRLKT